MSIWLPLESNPEVLTKYIHKLGVSKDWALCDVLGLNADMLEWVPRPVKSIILLFPCSEEYEKHRAQQHEELTTNPPTIPDDLFFMRQYTHNACGTVALIHSIANNDDIGVDEGVLKSFLENAKNLTPEERGKALENDKEFTADHQLLAREGQTAAEDNVFHHFVAFVNKNGILYELDGRKSFPIDHGATCEETFLKDSAKLCLEFMARDPEDLHFTVMALAAAQD